MALTLPKWLLVVAIGCATLWFGLLFERPSKPVANPNAQVAATNVYAIGGVTSRAADRLRLLKIRDSILREAARQPHAGLTVMISDGYEQKIRDALDSLLHERWRSLGGSSTVPIVIAAVVDSARTEAGVPRPQLSMMLPISVFLPQATDGSSCVSIIRIPGPMNDKTPAFLRRNLLSPETVGALFGPCMYFAAFGSPGPQIERWLRGGSWRLAHYTDWTAPPHPWTAIEDRFAPVLIERMMTLNDRSWRVREVVATQGLACLAGQPDRCAQAALPTPTIDADSAWRKGVVSTNGSNQILFYLRGRGGLLGPSDGWILSEMARTLGKDRFARFWRSSDSVPQAFQAAAGQSFDDWIHDWGRRMYGPVTAGPHLASNDLFAGLLLAALAVAGSIAITRRRRVA